MDDIDSFISRSETLARGLGSAVEHGLMSYAEADTILGEHALRSFPQNEDLQYLAIERLTQIIINEAGGIDQESEAAAFATVSDLAIGREIAGNLMSVLGRHAAARTGGVITWVMDDGDSFQTGAARIDNRVMIITGDGGATMRRLEQSRRHAGNLNGGYVDYAITRMREEADGFNATNGKEIISIAKEGQVVLKVPVPGDVPSTENILTAGEATLFLVGKVIAIRENIVAEIASVATNRTLDTDGVGEVADYTHSP